MMPAVAPHIGLILRATRLHRHHYGALVDRNNQLVWNALAKAIIPRTLRRSFLEQPSSRCEASVGTLTCALAEAAPLRRPYAGRAVRRASAGRRDTSCLFLASSVAAPHVLRRAPRILRGRRRKSEG